MSTDSETSAPPAPVTVPSPRVEGPLTTGRPLRPIALAALTIVGIVLCAWLAWPFLPAVTWALALAIIAWPLHNWMSRHVPWRGLAAGLSALLVFVLIGGPILFVTYALAGEAATAADKLKDRPAADVVQDTLDQTPGLNHMAAWAERVNLNIGRSLQRIALSYTHDEASLVQGSVTAIVQAAVALFILFHLFKDRTRLLGSANNLLPLTRSEAEQVFERVAATVHANLYANVVTSLVAAVGGGVMFWLVGLPSAILWAAVMFVLSLLPVLGTFLVWVPAVAYLGLTDRWPQAAMLGTWGVLNTILVDNLLYVRLAGRRMQLHQVPALLSILGGLALFGASGIILGPTILAVTVALLEVWHRRAVVTPVVPVGDPAAGAPAPPVDVPRAARPERSDGPVPTRA